MSSRKPLVILGLDSLPPDLVLSLAANGTMPFMAELIAGGSFGKLQSVTPAHTGPGWNSAWTGLKPAGHGYFGFCHYDCADDTIRLSTSDRLTATTLWEMFNKKGLRTIVINSPMQFPATELDGIMVSGFMTPSARTQCTFPESFRAKLLEDMPDYMFNIHWEKRKDEDAVFESNIAGVLKAFGQRVRAAELAAGCGRFDMLLVVFKSIDNMLHYTWDYVANGHNHPTRHALAMQAFKGLDEACRQIAIMAGYPDVNVLLCSDHGHCALRGYVHINGLLAEGGFLKVQTRFERFASKLVSSYRKRFSKDPNRKRPSLDVGTRMQINWRRSAAITIESGIYFNVKGRQPHGTVLPEHYEQVRDEIVSKLRSIKDEEGNYLIQQIDCPCEASPAPLLPNQPAIPDIVIQPVDGVQVTARRGPVWQPGCHDNMQGCHAVNGFVLGAGPAFEVGRTVEGDLYDIAPTALAACGLSIPEGLDGKPVCAMLRAQAQITYEAAGVPSSNIKEIMPGNVYNRREEEHVTEQLRNLGYID